MEGQPEVHARKEIDRQLQAAGWAVQDRSTMNFYAGLGVAKTPSLRA